MIIGLDVGGTHTDVVLLGDEGVRAQIKVPTDPHDLFRTVLASLEEITKGIDPDSVQRIVLSTTLTTNAIVQSKIPPVGMIVSSGPGIDPAFYRTNSHYFAVSGSIDHRGREITPIDEKEIRDIAAILKREGIRHVGVVGKFSVRNPRHELQIHRILSDGFERVFMGHQVSGNLNFSRRVATTYLNTAVFPLHRRFFQAVKMSLIKKGLQVPIHILKADGGTMDLAFSMDFPGRTILSGPAASVMGSIAFSPENTDAMSLDIGGTTTDMALISNRVPLLHPVGIRLGGYQTLIRSLDTRSIGIGGDSLVKVRHDDLVIGPQREGPAMAFGGRHPTVTDALVVLGRVNDGDRDSAIKGIQSIADVLAVSVEEAAFGIFDAACRKILAHAQKMIDRVNNRPVYTVQDIHAGANVDPTMLLVLGGPATYFAEHFKEISDYDVRVIPRWQVANAIGAALARTTCEVTLFTDTQLGIAVAPEEDFKEKVGKNFSDRDAVRRASALLNKKALQIGAAAEDLETEVLEAQQFNMVRGFLTTGKNIRVKVQVKPGLIHAYDTVVEKLAG